ncbi:MAG: hypothetical protein HF967_07260 [Methanosarcinales archaeon]|nr:hypothetical protein [Methanosarcinales archaeon]
MLELNDFRKYYCNTIYCYILALILNNTPELAKNRKIYIEKYLYKIDGKATERVVNLIEEIIRKKRK